MTLVCQSGHSIPAPFGCLGHFGFFQLSEAMGITGEAILQRRCVREWPWCRTAEPRNPADQPEAISVTPEADLEITKCL